MENKLLTVIALGRRTRNRWTLFLWQKGQEEGREGFQLGTRTGFPTLRLSTSEAGEFFVVGGILCLVGGLAASETHKMSTVPSQSWQPKISPDTAKFAFRAKLSPVQTHWLEGTEERMQFLLRFISFFFLILQSYFCSWSYNFMCALKQDTQV